MLTTELKETFFSLVRLGIGNASAAKMPESIDWNALEALAAQHGLSAVLVDGVERLPDGQRPPKPVLLQWIGETLQGFEYRYELYCRTIAEMAAFYNEHGYKMMVLKGYACSLDWPKPEHRPCGDIASGSSGRTMRRMPHWQRRRGLRLIRATITIRCSIGATLWWETTTTSSMCITISRMWSLRGF